MKTQAATSTTLDDTSSITLHVVNQPIENIFKLIEKQTGLTFYYGRAILDGSQRASVSMDKASLSEVMGVLLKGKNVSWTVKDKGVVLSKSSVVPEKVTTNIAGDTVPKIDVSGVVVDVKGNPIAGASVALKGQARGQGTDAGGRFSFAAAPSNGILIVSSLGFDPKQVKIAGKRDLRVTLDSSIREIQAVEVVSTGYQTLPKERMNGSFVQLSNADINRTVSTNILDKIFNITNSLKVEKEAGGITIRGFSSINANNYPLIVIDGFPYEEETGILNNLNPNDVESITVLRDAASSSIWGARSGNGVIVITTKKGNFNKKISIQFNSNINVIEKPRLGKLRLMSSSDVVDFEKTQFAKGTFDVYDDILANIQVFPLLSPVIEVLLAQRRGELTSEQTKIRLSEFSNHDVRDDISKYLVQTGINQQHNLNVSGGSDKVSYYGSIGYDKGKSTTIGNSSDRITLRMDNTFKPFRIAELRTFVAYTQGKSISNGIDYSSFIADGKRLAAPYTFLADNAQNPTHVPLSGIPRSAYLDTVQYPNLFDWHYRPLDELNLRNNVSKQFSTRLGGSLKLDLLKDLNAEFKGQYEIRNSNSSQYSSLQSFTSRNLINTFANIDANGEIRYPIPIGGIQDYSTGETRNWNIRLQLNYNKSSGSHLVSALAGYETSESIFSFNSGRKYGYDPLTELFNQNMDYNSTFNVRPSGTGRITHNASGSGILNRTISYFGNAGYSYDDKYSLTTSGRIDASNFLGSNANDRMIPLWSAGLGWNISRETFYNVTAFPYIKLRVTYGYNGNLNNKATPLPTALYKTASTGTNIYHNEPSLTLLTAPNPGLTWEKIRTINFGIDFESKNSRLRGSIDYYTKRGINLIGPLIVEATTGVTNYVTNYASMKGKGFDLQLKSIPLNGTIIWQNDFSFSYNTDEVTDINENKLTASQYALASNIPIVGKPLQKRYSIPSAGLDPANGQPRSYLKGEITDFNNFLQNATIDDLKYHGPATPQFFGNMINTFTYKNILLSFNITYRLKYFIRRATINYNSILSFWGGHSDYSLRWQKPGDETHTTVPSLSDPTDGRSQFYSISSDVTERGDHIRFQDIRLSYSLDASRLTQLHLSGLSIFAYANNLGIIWQANKSGVDPDFAENAIPLPRSIAFGINISF